MANTPRIWDYLNAISQTGDLSVLNDMDFDSVYNPFIINKMLAQHKDCVLAANQVNERSWMPHKAQFRYLLNTLRKRFRKNEKSEKHTDPDDVGAVAEYYFCSTHHARDLVSLHSSDQLMEIHRRLDKGGAAKRKGRTHGEPT